MKRFPLAALVLLGCLTATVTAGPLQLGGRAFDDQFDRSLSIGPAVKTLVFAPDRAAGKIASAYLNGQLGQSLEARGIRYLADISGMPGLINKLFAIPAMQDYGYPVLLGRQAAQTADLPRREGEVSVLRLQDGEVTAVAYAADAEALAALLPED